MNRSAHPVRPGSPPNAGVSVKPQHLISFTNVVAVYWLPQSWRSATPRATFGAIEPKAAVLPWRIGSRAAPRPPPGGALRRDRAEGRGHPLADRFKRRPPIPDLRHVPAHHLGRVVIDRAEEAAPPPGPG